MEIKKFEAYKYKYRGKGLDVNRKEFLEEMWSFFEEGDILGYEIISTAYIESKEILMLFLNKQDANGEYTENEKVIQLDFSDMGIEIGTMKWNKELEDYEEFVPEANLDTQETKQIKNYKKDIRKYNI